MLIYDIYLAFNIFNILKYYNYLILIIVFQVIIMDLKEIKLNSPITKILKRLWPTIHIVGTTFDSTTNKTAFKCLFYSLANLLPDEMARNYMYQFIKEYPIDNYLQTNTRAFYWTYLLHEFINIKLNKRIKFTFEEAKKLYNPDDINKTIWGQNFWILIHTIAKYVPVDSNGQIPLEARLIFIDFIKCLEKLLPCEKCRRHMTENLKKYPTENYINSRLNLFSWTVLVHNEVNSSLGKLKMTVKEAWFLY
jgi:hypothetical protein